MSFPALVAAELGFLIEDHAFACSKSVADVVEFTKYPLVLAVYWHKGELDLDVVVDIEFTVDHPVFRPFLSRTFPLAQVVKQVRGKSVSPSEFGATPGPILTEEQVGPRLRACARLLKRHCGALLDGDLAALEAITRRRGG